MMRRNNETISNTSDLYYEEKEEKQHCLSEKIAILSLLLSSVTLVITIANFILSLI